MLEDGNAGFRDQVSPIILKIIYGPFQLNGRVLYRHGYAVIPINLQCSGRGDLPGLINHGLFATRSTCSFGDVACLRTVSRQNF